MGSDDSLIAAAGKAAGIPWQRWDYERIRNVGHMVTRSMLWNPIDNDGDALRLATTLRIEVLPGVYGANRTDARNHHGEYFTEQHLDDPNAATRRAIVRAAAELGSKL